MKQFNKELHEDIMLLKTLHAKKDKTEFNNLKAEIMQKHKISKATVYREMKKESPGEYKIPNYNPPKMDIRMPEILMVRELLIGGRQAAEIIKIMGKELDLHYTWDRFNAARKLAEELDENQWDPKKTAFARNGHWFFTNLFDLQYMAPGTCQQMYINGYDLKVTRENYDLHILLIMQDNPIEGEDVNMKELRDEVINHRMLKINTQRTIKALTNSREPGSAYALKNLYDLQEKLLAKDKRMDEKSRYLLHRAKTGMVDEFYAPEYMDNPSNFEFDEKLEAKKYDLPAEEAPKKKGRQPTIKNIKDFFLRKTYEDYMNRKKGIPNKDGFVPDEQYLQVEKTVLLANGMIERDEPPPKNKVTSITDEAMLKEYMQNEQITEKEININNNNLKPLE